MSAEHENPVLDPAVQQLVAELLACPEPEPAELDEEDAPYGVTSNGYPVPGGFTGTLIDFLAFVKRNLRCGQVRLVETCEDLLGTEVQVIEMVTGGWSDDEDLLGRVAHGSLFAMMFWESTHRGGLYRFEVPIEKLESQDVHTWLAPPSDVFESVPQARELVVLRGEPRPGGPGGAIRVPLPRGARLHYREDGSGPDARGVLTIAPIPSGERGSLRAVRP